MSLRVGNPLFVLLAALAILNVVGLVGPRQIDSVVQLGSLAGLVLAAVLVHRSPDQWRSPDTEVPEALPETKVQDRQLRALGEMSAVLAHEIRNPLASLKGNAQLLAEAESASGDPKQLRRVDRVVSEAVRLDSLCSDLLEFTRTGELRIEEVELEELFASTLKELRHGEMVTVAVAGELTSWALDPMRMRQVLVNLLNNALHASPEPKTVRLEVELAARNEIQFAVLDRGPGISAEDAEGLFEAFRTTKAKGTGLGLAVVRRFVTLHGGTVVAGAREGGGARFDVRLPRTPEGGA